MAASSRIRAQARVSTLIRSACVWSVPGPVNLYPVLLARLAPWTRAPPMPPAAPQRSLRAAAQSCDHTAETEVPGLIRGAGVLISALGNSYTAPDISICSPDARQAVPDCTQSRLEAKVAHHGPQPSPQRFGNRVLGRSALAGALPTCLDPGPSSLPGAPRGLLPWVSPGPPCRPFSWTRLSPRCGLVSARSRFARSDSFAAHVSV